MATIYSSNTVSARYIAANGAVRTENLSTSKFLFAGRRGDRNVSSS